MTESAPVTLNTKQYSTEGEPLLILHGLLGSLANWGWHSRRLAADFAVTGIDLRNHGGSGHSDAMDYPLMAADVLAWLDEQGIERCHVLGHSMGGKVAMQLALTAPARIGRLVVADIAPVEYPSEHDSIFQGLAAVDLKSIGSRADADAILAQHVEDEQVRQFLLTSLLRDPEQGFQWRFNLSALRSSYGRIRARPEGSQPFDGPTLFIKGGRSTYILDEYEADIRALFPHAVITAIPHTGHWLHAEKPETFYHIVHDFLTGQSGT